VEFCFDVVKFNEQMKTYERFDHNFFFLEEFSPNDIFLNDKNLMFGVF